MGEDSTKDSSLRGEVWRGEVEGHGLCAVANPDKDGPYAYVWVPLWNEWMTSYEEESGSVFAAWALAERERAEKAEKIAAAERRLRIAKDAWLAAMRAPNGVTYTNQLAACAELQGAEGALRALGVEP
jgi:hypothetical protein